MCHLYYQIGGEIKRQSDGGSIGVDLTNEVCCLNMVKWDRKYLKKLKKLGIKMIIFKRFVDDTPRLEV